MCIPVAIKEQYVNKKMIFPKLCSCTNSKFGVLVLGFKKKCIQQPSLLLVECHGPLEKSCGLNSCPPQMGSFMAPCTLQMNKRQKTKWIPENSWLQDKGQIARHEGRKGKGISMRSIAQLRLRRLCLTCSAMPVSLRGVGATGS